MTILIILDVKGSNHKKRACQIPLNPGKFFITVVISGIISALLILAGSGKSARLPLGEPTRVKFLKFTKHNLAWQVLSVQLNVAGSGESARFTPVERTIENRYFWPSILYFQ